MTDNHDAAYYSARAEQEEAAARIAANPLAASIHRSLAERYRAKAYGLDDRRGLKLARD